MLAWSSVKWAVQPKAITNLVDESIESSLYQ